MLNPVFALGALLALAWPFQPALTQTIDSTYAISARGTLKVVTPSGDIHVKSWEGDTVKVTARKRATSQAVLDSLKIDAASANGDVEIQTVYPLSCSDCDISYDIQVPRGVSVDARTASGDISVTRAGGPVDVETSSGNIRVDAASASVRCKTASGDIKVTNARGDVDARASSGDVEARFDALGAVRAIALDTANGNITLAMPRGAGATIDVSTISGSIRSELGMAARQGYAGATLVQTTGDGRVRIKLSAISGDVALRAQ